MIRTSTVGDLTTVSLTGHIGVDEIDHLQKGLDAAIAAGRVEVDLAGCQSLSSSAIGSLIACHNTMRPSGGRLRVRGSSEEIRRLLKLMGLDRHFELA